MIEFPSNFTLEEMLHYGNFPEQLTKKVYSLIEDLKFIEGEYEEKMDKAEDHIEDLYFQIQSLEEQNYELQQELDDLKENKNDRT